MKIIQYIKNASWSLLSTVFALILLYIYYIIFLPNPNQYIPTFITICTLLMIPINLLGIFASIVSLYCEKHMKIVSRITLSIHLISFLVMLFLIVNAIDNVLVTLFYA